MPAIEPTPCSICMLRTTSTLNFLLNCCVCKRGYHHRCCRPPIPDGDLSSLIRATSKNKPGKGVKYWKCYTCRERPLPSAPDPGPSTRRDVSISGPRSSYREVIVISSDDEDMPEADIVVSNYPLSSRQDTKRKRPTSLTQSVPSTIVADKGNGSKSSREHPLRRSEDAQMEVDTAPEYPLHIPPTTLLQPSTSRFGLLSPPADSRSTTCARDDAESTQIYSGDNHVGQGQGQGSTSAQLHLDTSNPSLPVTVLPTPPVSSCASPPVAQGPRIPPIWAESESEENDDLGVRRMHTPLSTGAASTSASRTVTGGGGRKPRKIKAKPLEEQRHRRSPGQRAFLFVDLPR